jgi:hypothetical protein
MVMPDGIPAADMPPGTSVGLVFSTMTACR